MKFKYNKYNRILLICLSLYSCSAGNNEVEDEINKISLISFSAVSDNSLTKTDNGEISYIKEGSKIALKMFYDNRTTSDNNTIFNSSEETYLSVLSDGQCSFSNNTFNNTSIYDNDVVRLYWNNRKNHFFIAYTHDNELPAFNDADSLIFNITDQKDPLLAVVSKQPAGGTSDANKVSLIFEHQLSLVQVNAKPDGVSVGADGEIVEIKKIDLLGVSEKAFVYTSIDEKGNIKSTTASDNRIELNSKLLDSK